jgi:drug/metabolite transporter (DMT)-like permease
VTLVLFGSSFPAFKLATERFGVGTVVGLRFALATATLIVIFRGLPALEPRMWRRLLAIGALGLGGQAVTMIAGIDAGSSTLGALVLGLEPIGVAVAAVLVARERPTPATLLGLGLGLCGVAVVSGLFTSGVSGGGRPVAFLLVTVVLFAAYTVSVRREAGRVDAGAVALVTSIGACIVTLPLIALDAAHGQVVQGDLDWSSVAVAVYIGVGSGIAYFLFAHVLSRLPASRFAVAMYAVPTLGVLASWAVLGERPIARDVVGGAMILAAVWVAEHRRGGRDVGAA